MQLNWKKLFWRSGLLICIFTFVYILIVFWWGQKQRNIQVAVKQISEIRWNVVANRLALMQLEKLRENTSTEERASLFSRLNQEELRGRELIEQRSKEKEVNLELGKRWEEILRRLTGMYESQGQLLTSLRQQQTYAAGIEILRSERATKLIVEQTNLIYELSYWEDLLREKLKPNQKQ